MSKAASALKRVLLGRPMSSGELEHTLLPKIIALPVFSSDPLSSVAYATQEVLLVLGMAGTMALSRVVPISFAVALLLLIVVTSYRQTVRAYPSGGGAYRVARENLGTYAGLVAAGALLLDYVLTVSVSVTAGTEAVVSAAPGLAEAKVGIAIGFVVFVTLMNLRGVKESGVLFAVPTYGFVLSIYALLAAGFVNCLNGCPQAESAGLDVEPHAAITAFLMLKAFSAGTTALTGVEAIADGVAAFRYPQSRNAAATLAIMGTFSITMFLGISWLADHTNVVYVEHAERTVVAQVAHAVFHGGVLFYFVQVMTAAILVLAANTAFQDFPRLSSILAQDNFMPRQFLNRGDRLVFSNGIIILATFASLLIWVFDANLNRLIQLYLVGVFISFTLSQLGMTLRWWRLKGRGWQRRAVINGFGSLVTGVVLCVVIATKFINGAWIILTALPIVILVMKSIHTHYQQVRAELAHPARRPPEARPGNQHMVILVNSVDAATARAVGYVRSMRPSDVSAITFDNAWFGAWNRLAPDIPLSTLDGAGLDRKRLVAEMTRRRAQLGPHDFLTLMIPEVLRGRGMFEILRRPGSHRLKAAFLGVKGVQLLNIPVVKEDIDPAADPAHEPARNFVCVLVAGVNNATLQAIEYAETLQSHDLRCLYFGLEAEDTERLGDQWLAERIPHPLEIEASPYRDIGLSLIQYLRQFRADGVDRVVTVVLPEFVVSRLHHQILHNQTALIMKRRLLFEKGVVTVSVPYHLKA